MLFPNNEEINQLLFCLNDSRAQSLETYLNYFLLLSQKMSNNFMKYVWATTAADIFYPLSVRCVCYIDVGIITVRGRLN